MSNGIEPEVRKFLSNVMFSIGAGLLWLMINMVLGIFLGWMFYLEKPTVGNYIFYIWFFVSLVALVILLFRMWRKKFPHG